MCPNLFSDLKITINPKMMNDKTRWSTKSPCGQYTHTWLHVWTLSIFKLSFFSPLFFLAQEALKTLAVSLSPHNAAASPPPSKPRAPPITGTPDTLASIHLLPARYRRRPLALEEMEYIQVRLAWCSPAISQWTEFYTLLDFSLRMFWTVFLGHSGGAQSDKIGLDGAPAAKAFVCRASVFCSSAQKNPQ